MEILLGSETIKNLLPYYRSGIYLGMGGDIKGIESLGVETGDDGSEVNCHEHYRAGDG